MRKSNHFSLGLFSVFAVAWLFAISSCTKHETIFVPYPVHDTLAVGSISGVVQYPGGVENAESHLPTDPLWNAKVVLFQDGNKIDSTLTDKAGLFVFADLPVGKYKVEISNKFDSYLSTETFETDVLKDSVSVLRSEEFDCILMRMQKLEKKKWTFLHFINSTEYSIRAGNVAEIRIQELCGGSGAELNNIAYFAPGDQLGPSIYYLQYKRNEGKDPDIYNNMAPTLLSSHYVYNRTNFKDYKNDGDPGDYRHLVQILEKVSRLYPSDSIALFLYGHGSGIENTPGNNSTKCILPNDRNNTEITVKQFGEIFDMLKGKLQVNVLVSGSCYMGMYEVAYELKDSGIKYVLLSPPTGAHLADYYQNIEYISKMVDGQCTSSEMASEIVAKVRSNCLSAWDMSKFADMEALFEDFANKINKTPLKYTQPLIYRAENMGNDNLNYYMSNYFDLADFAEIVGKSVFEDTEGVIPAAAALANYIKSPGPGKFMYACKTTIQRRWNGISMLMLRPGNHYNVLWDDYRVLKCYNQGTKSWDEYLSKINWDIDYAPEWDGSIQQPAIMTDTEISINNASELAWVAQQTNSGADSFAGKTIKLLFDLNLGGAKKQNWTPIGTLDHPFKGTFDGDVFYIRSLYISSEDAPYVGLFGYVQDASITQCRVMGEITANYTGNLSGTSNIGGICGAIGGYAVPTSITKSLSDLEIKVNNGTTTVNVGGICGLLSGSVNMEDTRNSSSITVVSGKTSANAGGICGSAMSTSMAYPVIKHCYNDHISLNVTGEETSILGGICGYTDNSELKILNCFVGGRMYLKGNGYLYCGGILGGTNEVATPMIAYATCEALISVNRTDNAGNAYTGGIAGYGNASIFASASTSEKIEASTGSFVAGILGAGTSAKIASCSYSGLSDIAGIIAKADSGCEIANCFYASSKAIGEGTPKSDNSKKYASSAWPTDALAGWGATKPDFWPQSPDWESPWSSLGSWRDEAPAYPVVKFEWANY